MQILIEIDIVCKKKSKMGAKIIGKLFTKLFFPMENKNEGMHKVTIFIF